MSRTVLFAEVPCFYASVERADDPALEERPLIVGGDPRKRGLVQGASPEALEAGVELEMPVIEALRLCPQARSVRTNMHRYREVSRRLFAGLRRGFEQLEPSGLSAAYFDVTGAGRAPEAIAEALRGGVAADLGLSLRVGAASGKFLARLAAEESDAGGIRRLRPDEEQAFLAPLPVDRLEGVGQKTATALAEMGAQRIGEVVALGRDRLQSALGTNGLRIHAFASGVDDRPVRAARHPQSLSREATLGESLDLAVLRAQLQDLAQLLEAELQSQGLGAGRVALKLRFQDRVVTTRSQTLPQPVVRASDIHGIVEQLLELTEAGSRPARGVGIQLSRLRRGTEADRQLDLFPR